MDNGPFARVMEAMYFASAQNQSDMISADVRRALQNNFQKYKVIPRSSIPDGWIPVEVDMGFYSNGKKRTGYKAEPDPNLAPKIREAIDQRLHGATLEEMKIIVGGSFANKPREYMRRLMLKPLLYGQMTYGGTVMDNYCEPIISKETFDNVQLYNKYAPKEHVKPQSHYSKNRPLLSDMLYCGVCGKKAFLDRRKAKGKLYETYYCNDKHVGFRRQIIEKLVIEKGIELLSDAQYQKNVEAIVDTLNSPFPDKMDNSSITAEIAKIDRKIERISSAIEDSDDAPATLVKRLSELEKQRAEFTQSLQSSESEDAHDKILEECHRIRHSILEVLKNEKSSTDELRSALSLFVHSIVIYPESKVLIRHTLPGFGKVASTTSGIVLAPPVAVSRYSQLFETLCIL